MATYYTEIREIPKMSQEDIIKEYEKEGIYKTDLDNLIQEVKNQLEPIDNLISGSVFKFKTLEPVENVQELKEQKKGLEAQLSKLKHQKCYRFIKGMNTIVRNYPSQELINTIANAHLYLAYNMARKYYKKTDCDKNKYSFDDLYQLAAETLLYAAKQYVPGGEATFVTYARKCIENRLNREIYGEKKKTRIKVDFFTLEFERMDLARSLLLHLNDNNFFIPKEKPKEEDNFFLNLIRREQKPQKPYAYLYKGCNKDIRKFNKKMARCFEETIPHIKEEHPIEDLTLIYQKLLSKSLIDRVITKDDEWIIRKSMRRRTNYTNKSILSEVNRIDFYLHKLAIIKAVLEFEKEYMKAHEGVRPSEEEIYASLSKMIKKENKFYDDEEERSLLRFRVKNLTTYDDVYFSKYKIRKSSPDSKEQRKKEIKNLYNEFKQRYSDILEKEEADRTEEDNQFLSTYCKDGKRNIKGYIYDSMNQRKKEARKLLHQENMGTLNAFHIYCYLLPNISLDDVKSAYKTIATVQSLDQLEQERGNKKKAPILTPEEKAIENGASELYERILESLPEKEKEVLKLWMSSDGYKQNTLKEIAKILCISERSARSAKERALKKLRQNKELIQYLQEPKY